MLNQKLLDYIKEERLKGIDDAAITTALLKIGWQQEEIDSAFKLLSLEVPAPSPTPTPTPQQQVPSQAPNYLPGVMQITSEAWQIYQARFKTLIAISLIPIIFLPIIFISAIAIPLIILSLGISFALILLILITIIALFVILLNLWAPLAQLYAIKDHNEKIGFKAAFGRSRSRVFLYVIFSFLFFMMAALGYIFFIVPGIIFSTWFVLAPYVFVIENTGPIAALKKSKEYVSGKFFAVLYRMIGIGLLIGFINFIVGLIPVVNLFAFLIYPLVTIPLLTISYFVLYEKLRDLNGKPISNQPNKPFISVILFALALIVFLILVVLAYAVPNIIKNYSRQPTSHTIPSTQNNNSTVTNTFPTSPSQFRTSSNTQNISDCTSSTYEKVENKDMTNIQNAVIAYTKNHGMFPKNIPLIGTPEKEISSDGADICSDLIPAYLSALPESPCINNGISITSCSSNYDTGYEVGLEKVGTQTAIVVDWVNPEIRSGNSTNKQSPTSATPSTVTAQTEPYPNITIYPNAPIGFYAHDLDGKCCAYRGGCRNGSCGNFCVELVDESYCTKVSSTP